MERLSVGRLLSSDDAVFKSQFVDRVCAMRKRGQVWDLGANDGHYARIAERHAEYVVAFDFDRVGVERLHRQLVVEGSRTILPLVMDLVEPSPGTGWRSRERRSLEDRASADLVLALAVVHHLVVSRNVPFPEIAGWLASLAPEAVVELPLPTDPQVQRLLRNKHQDASIDYGVEAFESAITADFRVLAKEMLPSGRRLLYHLSRQSRDACDRGRRAPGSRPCHDGARAPPDGCNEALRGTLRLTGFAVAQPLLSVYGKAPEEFVFRRVDGVGVIAFAAVVVLGPPLLLWLLGSVVAMIGRTPRIISHDLLMGALWFLLAVQVLQRADVLPLLVILLGGVLVAALGISLGIASRGFRSWLTFASPAPLVFALVFLLLSPSRPGTARPPTRRNRSWWATQPRS